MWPGRTWQVYHTASKPHVLYVTEVASVWRAWYRSHTTRTNTNHVITAVRIFYTMRNMPQYVVYNKTKKVFTRGLF
jgi:hypothetical protein